MRSAGKPVLGSPASTSALEAARMVHAGALTPLDLVEASIARIEKTDVGVNALPVRCFDRARRRARELMVDRAAGDAWPPLAGLTLAVKDNTDVGDVPTSGGSAITAGRVPDSSDPVIARLERAGAIVVAKSNLSELGGANTVNALFGATRNPHGTGLTAGGSSGGSAAALALGQVHLGHGNDVGGSLRTPAAFCGVAGLRPTPGLVPRKPMSDPFDTVFVEGPMARTVADLALMLDAMAGFHAADPLSRGHGGTFLEAALRPTPPRRIATSEDLGILPVESGVRAEFRALVAALAVAGAEPVAAWPDLAGLPDAIKVHRGMAYLATWGHLWPRDRSRFTAEVAGDIARGLALKPRRIASAMADRATAYRHMIRFFEMHDLLICPVAQVKPFPVEERWPREIEGVTCETYVDWIMITYVWSALCCPALSVPVGFGADGLPLALQIVGPPHSEARLLAAGAWIETALAAGGTLRTAGALA